MTARNRKIYNANVKISPVLCMRCIFTHSGIELWKCKHNIAQTFFFAIIAYNFYIYLQKNKITGLRLTKVQACYFVWRWAVGAAQPSACRRLRPLPDYLFIQPADRRFHCSPGWRPWSVLKIAGASKRDRPFSRELYFSLYFSHNVLKLAYRRGAAWT